ncbi:unnamed protein product, partial [Polarella glacialis]
VRNHGVPQEVIARARAESTKFFDQPLEVKQHYAVHGMERNRGYEIYPHHLRFIEKWQAAGAPLRGVHPEPSATQGIVSERFCCGPPVCEPSDSQSWQVVQSDAAGGHADPHYGSSLGQVFFPQNVWPTQEEARDLAQLRPALLETSVEYADGELWLLEAGLRRVRGIWAYNEAVPEGKLPAGDYYPTVLTSNCPTAFHARVV